MKYEAVKAVALKMRRRTVGSLPYEDLLSVGTIAALQVPDHIDCLAANYAMLNAIRSETRCRARRRIPHGALDWQERRQLSPHEAAQLRAAVDAMRCLTKAERYVIQRYFWGEMLLSEIGRSAGKSANWAWHKLHDGLEKMRRLV